MATPEYPISWQHKATLSPQYSTFPRGSQPVTWCKLIKLDSFLHEKGSALFFLEQTLSLDMDLPSLHSMLLPKLQSTDLQNALSTIMVFHTALLLIKGLNSQQIKYRKGAMLMVSSSLTMFPTILKKMA